MSSYYTTAQLEAMRKARLKQDLADTIQRLKEQLQIKHENTVIVNSGSNIETTVIITDDAVSGSDEDYAITGDMILSEEVQRSTKRDELDFSDLLAFTQNKQSKLSIELDTWIKKSEERPIISQKDENDRTRLIAELARIVQSKSDIEDKIKLVKTRVSSYLLGATKISEIDKKEFKSKYYEYCALCNMLGVKPTEKFPHRVKEEIARMTTILEKRKQDEYVMTVIKEIMEDLGCHARDDAVLDHTIGQVYSVDGHPLCDVFIGNDGSGIMFEPIGESKDVSLDKKRQVESSANAICSMYSVLEERAAEKGVILQRVYIEPAKVENMCVQSDISERSAKKKQRKTVVQKQRALNTEE